MPSSTRRFKVPIDCQSCSVALVHDPSSYARSLYPRTRTAEQPLLQLQPQVTKLIARSLEQTSCIINKCASFVIAGRQNVSAMRAWRRRLVACSQLTGHDFPMCRDGGLVRL